MERHNLTIRQQLSRFTRRTNTHSKTLINHIYALSFVFVWYNWMRPHETLTDNNGGKPTTLAMAAGPADLPMSWAALLRLIDGRAPKPKPRGKYKKHIRPLARVRNAKRRADRELVQRAAAYRDGLSRPGSSVVVRTVG